jgi:hypothetical protein
MDLITERSSSSDDLSSFLDSFHITWVTQVVNFVQNYNALGLKESFSLFGIFQSFHDLIVLLNEESIVALLEDLTRLYVPQLHPCGFLELLKLKVEVITVKLPRCTQDDFSVFVLQ